ETARWRGGIQGVARKERAPTIGRMSGYAFHPDAFADLDEIWEYIAQDNVDAADRVLADIHSTLTLLAGSPQIGHRRPDLTTRPLRFHVARDEYLIAYAPDEKPLWGCGDSPWAPKSAADGCDPSQPTVDLGHARRRACLPGNLRCASPTGVE